MTLEAIRVEALKLTQKERAELAHDLIVSLDGDEPMDPDYERLWAEEIARRVQAIEEGTEELIPAEEVMASIRAKYS